MDDSFMDSFLAAMSTAQLRRFLNATAEALGVRSQDSTAPVPDTTNAPSTQSAAQNHASSAVIEGKCVDVPASPSLDSSCAAIDTPQSSPGLVSVDEYGDEVRGLNLSATSPDVPEQPLLNTVHQPEIPAIVKTYTKGKDGLTNDHVEAICHAEFAFNGKDYVIDDGNRPGINAAIVYSFLSAVRSLSITDRSKSEKHSPLFLEVMLNNAGVNARKELYEHIWRSVAGPSGPPLPVAFFKASMSREETESLLKKKLPIVVSTPGKLADLLDSKMDFDHIVKIVFDPLNALLNYNYEDKPIRKIIDKLQSNHHIMAITTSLSDELHRRFINVKPASFHLNLKDMIHFKDDRVAKLKWLLKHTEFVPTNDRKVAAYPSCKETYALKILTDAETRKALFGSRPVIAITNFKKTLRKLGDDAKTLCDDELPIFHGGEDLDDDERWENLRDFDTFEDKLACTRRSLYGYRFKFLPAILVVEFPTSYDEWLHIMQWYLALCMEFGLDINEDTDLPKIKFLYEVDNDRDYGRVSYVLRQLARQHIAYIVIPHKMHAAHRTRHYDSDDDDDPSWWLFRY